MIRASSLGKLMASAKSIDPSLITEEVKAIQKKPVAKRTEPEKELLAKLLQDTLPDGAITELDKIISQKLLNWRDEIDFLTLEKGRHCEDESIELYNDLYDTFYLKNTERVTRENLTGECDILDLDESLVIDIKTAYSKKTYPLFLKISTLYEWQLRAYMYLYNVDNAELAYCLVDTPLEFRKKSDPNTWHEMHDVPENLRVSKLRISRDLEKENQMLRRIELSMNYINEHIGV